jgi:hypothetical protein
MNRILMRVVNKIHLTKFIERGNRKPIKLWPLIFSEGFKGYFLTREEITFLEEYKEGDIFENYNHDPEYEAAQSYHHSYITGDEM